MRITNRTGKALYLKYRDDISLLSISNKPIEKSYYLGNEEGAHIPIRKDIRLMIEPMNRDEVFGIDLIKDEIEIYSETNGLILIVPDNKVIIDVRE